MPVKKANPAAVLAEKMVEVLRQRPADAPLLTLSRLAEIADPSAGARAILAVLFQRKVFTAVAARRDLAAPVALLSDLPRLAGSSQLLEFAIKSTRTAANHAFSIADLKKKLTGKLQAPFAEAVQQRIQQRMLPLGVGWILVKNTKRLFLAGDVHITLVEKDEEKSPPPLPAPQLERAPLAFSEAFDQAFARLDRAAGGHNFVSLADLRPTLDVERAVFDAGLREMRRAGQYTLSAAEGRHGLGEAERAAGVTEDGTLLLYVSRRAP
jgi:hypothetical protein